jgi:hypothetical protein
MNLASGQLKKICLQCSSSPQWEHKPSNGPLHLATCSEQGSLPRISCQINMFIRGGTLVRQTSRVTAAPWVSQRYMELDKKPPEASSGRQEMTFSSTPGWEKPSPLVRLHDPDPPPPPPLPSWATVATPPPPPVAPCSAGSQLAMGVPGTRRPNLGAQDGEA